MYRPSSNASTRVCSRGDGEDVGTFSPRLRKKISKYVGELEAVFNEPGGASLQEKLQKLRERVDNPDLTRAA